MIAQAAALGLDVEKMINGEPLERLLRVAIAERASDYRERLDDSLAVKIINQLAQGLKSG